MAKNFVRIEDTTDAEGYIVPGYSQWDCTAKYLRQDCDGTVQRYRGESDVSCPVCGAWYNASGQRLRDDWRDNPAWKYPDLEIGDLEGYEIQHAGD